MATRKRTKPEIVHLTQLHIESVSEEEIDFVLKDEFGLDKSNHNYQYVNFIEKGERPQSNNYPIAVDALLDMLTALKEKGCNYVSVDHHVDHIAYEVSGFLITPSTPAEIALEEAAAGKKEEAEKRVSELITEAKRIAKEAGLSVY